MKTGWLQCSHCTWCTWKQSVPLLPIPVGGGRRGVLGTGRAEWDGQWEQGLSFRDGSRPRASPKGKVAQGGQTSCIVAFTIVHPVFSVCLRALENAMNCHSHGRDLSFTYTSSIPGHFLRPFLSSGVPSHSTVKAQWISLSNTICYLFHLWKLSLTKVSEFPFCILYSIPKIIYKFLDNIFSQSM